jgi:hypothetical protein
MRILRIKTTAITLVGFFLGLLASSSLAAIWNQRRMISATKRITNNSLPVIYGVVSALSTIKDLRGKMHAHIVSDSSSDKDKGDVEIAALARQLDLGIDWIGNYLTDPEGFSLCTSARTKSQVFLEVWNSKVQPLSRADGQKAVGMAAFLDGGMAAFKSANDAFESLISRRSPKPTRTPSTLRLSVGKASCLSGFFWRWLLLAAPCSRPG